MKKDIVAVLSDPHNDFSKRQSAVARYICENFDKAAFMTAYTLSEEAGVSESTVLRFASELGFAGYPEMRRELQMVLRSRISNLRQANINELGTSGKALHNSLAAAVENIENTANAANEREFEAIVKAMLSANRIFLIGFGFYYYFAGYAEKVIELIHGEVYHLFGIDTAKFDRMEKGDLLLAICPAELSNTSLTALRLARDRGAVIASICSGEHHEEAKLSTYRLVTRDEAAIVSLINALAEALASAGNTSIDTERQKIRNIRTEYSLNGYIEN